MSRILIAATSALVLVAAAGCGGDSESTDTGSTPTPAGTAPSGDGEQGPADSPLAVVPDPRGDDPEREPDVAPDNGPEGQAPVGTGQDTSPIAGVWDYTRDVPEGTDIAFFEISATGTVVEYDYQGDDVGDGADCHTTFTASIASNGGDRYDIQDASDLPGAASIDDVLIAVEGGALVFRYLGDAFDPEFGEGMTGITESYPAAGISPTDLRICD